LKGKRVATIAVTSSGYFLERMLRSAGLSFDDIEAVAVSPLSTMPDALARREVDAVVIWEPYSENAVQALEGDVIEFANPELYSDHSKLASSAAKPADPATRAKIVEFVRAVVDETEEVRRDPEEAQRLVNQNGKHPPEQITRSWKHHESKDNYPD